MFRHVALALTASLGIAACGAPSGGVTAVGMTGAMAAKRVTKKPPTSSTPDTPLANGAYDGLEVLGIEALPVRCPCYELKATAKDGSPISIKFSGFTQPYAIDEVLVGDMAVTDMESRAALGKALGQATSKSKDKETAAQIKAVAVALAK